MSYLEKEGEDKGSGVWDWVVGIGLVLLIGGFTVYYQYQKRSSVSHSKQADSLFVAGDFAAAEKAYEELKNAQYLTNKDDSTIFARLDTIETAKENGAAQVAAARAKLQAGDTSAARSLLAGIRYRTLLAPEDRAFADSAASQTASAAAP